MLATMIAPYYIMGINPLDLLWISTLVAVVTISSVGVSDVRGGKTFVALMGTSGVRCYSDIGGFADLY